VQQVIEALSSVKAKDMTFLDVALIEAFNLFIEARLYICVIYSCMLILFD